MCGILGYYKLKDGIFPKNFADMASRLFVHSSNRGRDASGVSYFETDKDGKQHLMYYKEASESAKFVETPYWKNLMSNPPDMMIAHTRAWTKGKPDNNNNNHPMVGNGITLVHNGGITTEDALFKKYDLPREGEVDSEIIVRLLDYHISDGVPVTDAINETSKELGGTYACAFLHNNYPDSLFLFKKDNPIVLAYLEDYKLLVFASVQGFIEAAFAETSRVAGFFYKRNPVSNILYRELDRETIVTIGPNGVIDVSKLEIKPWGNYYGGQGFYDNSGRYNKNFARGREATVPKVESKNEKKEEIKTEEKKILLPAGTTVDTKTAVKGAKTVSVFTCPNQDCKRQDSAQNLETAAYFCPGCEKDLSPFNTKQLDIQEVPEEEWERIEGSLLALEGFASVYRCPVCDDIEHLEDLDLFIGTCSGCGAPLNWFDKSSGLVEFEVVPLKVYERANQFSLITKRKT